MKLLNLGCGSRYHKDWINMDFSSDNEDVITHNLLNGIPYENNTFDVVYHSHLLEHFSKADAVNFIKECHRVLKHGGVIRIVVPNLEDIVNNYKKYLKLALNGDKLAEANYDWTMIEMYDQCARNFSGGEMGKLYTQGDIPNPDFVYGRVGIRVKQKIKLDPNSNLHNTQLSLFTKNAFEKSLLYTKGRILKLILRKEFKYYELGKFRLNGEVHQWMYDSFSLARLLTQNGFKDTKVCKAWESRIPQWASFNLDNNPDETIYKPDSFYMEAIK